jgi:hypothetical protein
MGLHVVMSLLLSRQSKLVSTFYFVSSFMNLLVPFYTRRPPASLGFLIVRFLTSVFFLLHTLFYMCIVKLAYIAQLISFPVCFFQVFAASYSSHKLLQFLDFFFAVEFIFILFFLLHGVSYFCICSQLGASRHVQPAISRYACAATCRFLQGNCFFGFYTVICISVCLIHFMQNVCSSMQTSYSCRVLLSRSFHSFSFSHF